MIYDGFIEVCGIEIIINKLLKICVNIGYRNILFFDRVNILKYMNIYIMYIYMWIYMLLGYILDFFKD